MLPKVHVMFLVKNRERKGGPPLLIRVERGERENGEDLSPRINFKMVLFTSVEETQDSMLKVKKKSFHT